MMKLTDVRCYYSLQLLSGRERTRFFLNIYLINILTNKFCSCLDHVKCALFRSHCSAFYCGSLWTNFTVAGLRELMVCNKDILRGLLRVLRWTNASSTFARPDLIIKVLYRKFSFSLRTQIVNSQNPILDTIFFRVVISNLGYTVNIWPVSVKCKY